MRTDHDELIPRVNGLPEEAVFIGSGLVAGRRPGMTRLLLSACGYRSNPHISN